MASPWPWSAALLVVPALLGQDLSSIIEKIAPSVVKITSANSNGIITGSGFLVGHGLIVTNHHVVKDRSNFVIETADGNELPGESVLASDAVQDLAILRVFSKVPLGVPLKLSFQPPRRGSKVIVVGSPLGLEQSVSDGIVSAVRQLSGTELIQITAPISPGSSGSPVVDSSGEAIGVATFKLVAGENLNFAISIKHVRELLESRGIPTSATEEVPPPVVLDSEILSGRFFGVEKQLPDGPISDHATNQFLSAMTAYLYCQDFRRLLSRVYNREQIDNVDEELQRNIDNIESGYYRVFIDTRFDENAQFDWLRTKVVESLRTELNPLTAVLTGVEVLLDKLELYQEVFREVLRRYAVYSKSTFVVYADMGQNDAAKRDTIVDVYYPYLKKAVVRSVDQQERQDALDLLNPLALREEVNVHNQYLDSAEIKGVEHVYGRLALKIPKEAEAKLSIKELFALRESCFARRSPTYFGDTFGDATVALESLSSNEIDLLDVSVTNKKDSVLPLVPANRPDVKEALAWWVYWKLSSDERRAWHKYCRNVNKMKAHIDEILRRRSVRP
jgi:hypothetical protein